jgi:hypothetical protein
MELFKMLALVVAPGKYVQPRMRRYPPDLTVVRTIVAALSCPRPKGVLLTFETIADRLAVPEVVTVPPLRRACTSAVASDYSLTRAGAGGGRTGIGYLIPPQPALLQRLWLSEVGYTLPWRGAVRRAAQPA